MQNSITTNGSYILRSITQTEFQLFTEERELSGLAWGPHYLVHTPQQAPLRHGASIYIQSLHIESLQTMVDHRTTFANTLQKVASWVGINPTQIARAYWHRLQKKEWVEPHQDLDSSRSSYFKRIKRFHVFPQLPDDFIVIMDSKLWHKQNQNSVSLSLVDFDFKQTHSYVNLANTSIEFLVIDFFLDLNL